MRRYTLFFIGLFVQLTTTLYAQLNLTNGQNAIITQSPRTALTVVSTSSNHADVPATVQYLDGLGRPLQTLQLRAAGNAGTDVLTEHITYDAFGRPQTSLLLTPSAGGEGGFYTTVPSSATPASNLPVLTPISSATMLYGDTRPYTETVYEPSPLMRPIRQWGAGQNWFANNRSNTIRYSTAAGIIRFKASQIAIYCNINNQAPVEYFKSTDIARTIITDEQSNSTIAYTDLQGRTIRQDVVITPGDTLTTAYVYDNFERLSAVIPPKLYNWFKTGNLLLYYRLGNTNQERLNGPDNPLFKESAYVYLYDPRSRLTAKHVPNAGWTDFVYDQQDRLVMSQDQQDKADGQWRFMQYDGLDRVIITGRLGLPLGTNYTTDDLRRAFARQTTTNEERNTAPGNLLGYSQISFPNNSTVSIPVSATNVLTVNYYDDYGQNNLPYQAMPAPFATPYSTGGGNTARGLLTNTRTRVLTNTGTVGNTNPAPGALLETAFFYDNKGRVVQQRSQNHLGTAGAPGTDQTDIQYSFAGEILQTRLAHQPGPAASVSVVTTTYTYDHLGRRTQILHAIGPVAPTVLATYQYDAIGRLSGRQLGGGTAGVSQQSGNWPTTTTWVGGALPTSAGTAQLSNSHTVTVPANTTVGTNRLLLGAGAKLVFSAPNARLQFGAGNTGFLQRQTFHYHLRGWLRGMNLDANNQPSVASGQHFSFRLNYDENGRFDGNISRQNWAYARDTQPFSRTFAYAYDPASRLTEAAFTGNLNEGFSTSNLSYDPNGNLMTMNRTQRFSTNGARSWDILNYGYATLGNSLTSVADTAPVQPDLGDFREQNTTGADYAYNPDGTLLYDLNRGMNPIRYNLLKLPRELSLAGGSRIVSYTYTATGQKLRMRDEQAPALGGQLNAQRDYVGPFTYLNNTLFEIATDEGRWTPTGGYEYFLKDHLGNVRVAFNATGVTQYAESGATPV